MNARDNAIDVVVPVYRGVAETRACIESILSNRQCAQFELIVIDDCSPEPELADWLAEMAALGKCSLLKNEENRGFVLTANRGMAIHPERDVVLLNSDTVVANDWLDRLRECAYSDARIATVTPFSNNAEICSYPRFCARNQLPSRSELMQLDSLFASANRGRNVAMPTGVGFCLYLRRDALDDVGEFDADTFGAGYGEENDYCQRAIRRGWKNVLAANVYVGHAGGISFGAAQNDLKSRAMASLLKLHPAYLENVRKFIAADPVKPCRIAIDICRVATGTLPVVLAVSHARGGGTQKHIDDLARLMAGKAHCFTLRPLPGDWAELAWNQPGEALKLHFDLRADKPLLLDALRVLGVSGVHYHSLIDLPPALRKIAGDLNVPYDFTLHDYFAICPQIHLNYAGLSRYCGEQGEAQCKSCIRETPGSRHIDIAAWRSRNARFLARAARVIAPSRDVANRFARYLPSLSIHVVPHAEPAAEFPPPRRRHQLSPRAPLRIVVLGAISEIKGADLLEACAIDAANRNLPLRFELIGFAYRKLKTGPEASLVVYGPYEDHELANALDTSSPDLIWLPALVPETYGYTLSAAMCAQLPVVVPDIGAPPERIAGRPWSWQYHWQFSAAQMNDWLVDLRAQFFAADTCHVSPPQPRPGSARRFKYEENYIADAGHGTSSSIVPGQITALVEKICERDRYHAQAQDSVAARVMGLLRVIKHHDLLSKVVRRIPEHHQQKIKRFLLNVNRR